MYRPNEFYEYNASNWTNFPDEKNPYAPPGWTGASIGWIFGIKRGRYASDHGRSRLAGGSIGSPVD